jgi:UPF0755 protein
VKPDEVGVRERRGISDLDSLDSLDTLDWSADPWDDAHDAGTVERLRAQTRSAKWLAYTALLLSIVLVLVAGLAGWWYIHQINPEGEPRAPVSFTVRSDDTIDSISERLERRGLIVDAGVFRWYVERHGGLEITPGYYALAPGDHVGNILGRLRTPPSQTYTKVTFPEGFTVSQIAERLERDLATIDAADFLTAAAELRVKPRYRPPGVTSLEGLLFPDTYQISNGDNAGQVVERMLGLMERVGKQEEIEAKGFELGRSAYEILIIASMIEREAKVSDDRPKISRVIHNRLAIGMPLAIDATLLYQQDPDRPISELQTIDTPYNTYVHAGLPPTPIANPGRASIQAALNPAPNPSVGDPLCQGLPEDVECQYLFYVLANEDGGHAFAVTGEQHEANVQQARAAGLLD